MDFSKGNPAPFLKSSPFQEPVEERKQIMKVGSGFVAELKGYRLVLQAGQSGAWNVIVTDPKGISKVLASKLPRHEDASFQAISFVLKATDADMKEMDRVGRSLEWKPL